MENFDIYTITGQEKFTDGDQSLGFNMIDFWRFQFPNIYDYHGELAEFLVAKALGKEKADNKDIWTRYDINYTDQKQRDLRIEVKASAYYHSWQTDESKISMQRTFGISKSHSSYDISSAEQAGRKVEPKEDKMERPSDLYIFCLNTGFTRETAYTLNVDNWEFYIVPTYIIDEKCGDNKTISLNKIQSLGFKKMRYKEIRNQVELVSDEIHSSLRNLNLEVSL